MCIHVGVFCKKLKFDIERPTEAMRVRVFWLTHTLLLVKINYSDVGKTHALSKLYICIHTCVCCVVFVVNLKFDLGQITQGMRV